MKFKKAKYLNYFLPLIFFLIMFIGFVFVLTSNLTITTSPASEIPQVEVIVDSPEHLKRFEDMILKYHDRAGHTAFPLGFFAVVDKMQNRKEMVRLRENGITFVHKYDGSMSLKSAFNDLNAAKSAGIAVALNLPSKYLNEDVLWWENYINSLSKNNQFIMWYLPEEPKEKDIENLRKVANIIRRIDPAKRPIVTYLNSGDSYKYIFSEMSAILDGVVISAYPTFCNTSRAQTASQIRWAYQHGAPFAMVALEAFNTPNGWTPAASVDFDAFSALIHGSRVLWWYCYAQMQNKPELLEKVLDIASFINGPEYYGEVFLKGKDYPKISATLINGPLHFTSGFNDAMKEMLPNNYSMHWRAIEYNGYIYIVAVNTCEVTSNDLNDTDAYTIKLAFNGPSLSNISSLRGNGQIKIFKDTFELTLPPLGVAFIKCK